MLHLPPLRGKWALLAFGTLFSCQGAHCSASDTSCVRRVNDDIATPIQTTIPAQPKSSTGGGWSDNDAGPIPNGNQTCGLRKSINQTGETSLPDLEHLADKVRAGDLLTHNRLTIHLDRTLVDKTSCLCSRDVKHIANE